MTEIRYVEQRSAIPNEEGWNEKVAFKKRDEIVELEGREYRLEVKKTTKFSFWERVGRALLGILAVGFTVGISLASKSVRQLFTKETKASRIFAVLVESIDNGSNNEPFQMPPPPSQNKNLNNASNIDLNLEPVIDDGQMDTEESDTEESDLALRFYSQADQMIVMESMFKGYAKAIKSKKWDKLSAMLFLNDELHGIKGSLEKLREEVKETITECENEKDKDSIKTINELEESIESLIKKIDVSLKQVKRKIDKKIENTDLVPGLYNPGNTCYINSALQPLLAIRNFAELVPDEVPLEPEDDYERRKVILTSLKSFLTAWTERKSPTELGDRIGMLRREIFLARLHQGGFVDPREEREYQDSGSFFDLILHVIGRGFVFEVTTTPVMEDKRVLVNKAVLEQTPRAVFILNDPNAPVPIDPLEEGLFGPVQEVVNLYREALVQKFTKGNEWKVENPDSETQEEILLSDYMELQKIVGQPPELLVVRVKRIVDPEVDRSVNFEALFKSPSPDFQYDYELVGFSQNHNRRHWTSVISNGTEWKYCNDSSVEKIEPNHKKFKIPANYMVYKKKPKQNPST